MAFYVTYFLAFYLTFHLAFYLAVGSSSAHWARDEVQRRPVGSGAGEEARSGGGEEEGGAESYVKI